MDPMEKSDSDEVAELKRRLAEAEAALKVYSQPRKTVPHAAGKKKRVSRSAEKIKQDQPGTPQVEALLAAEISKRQQAERALLEAEARFKALTETSPVAMGISTPDGSFLYINKTYYRTFGYTLEEINQLKAEDLYCDPQDRPAWMAILAEKGILQDYEVRLKRKDGTPFWALISVVPVQLSGTEGYIGSVVDISERKQLEAELLQSETRHQVSEAISAERQRFYDVLERLPVMICLLTSDYRVAFANQAFRATFGEAVGRHCFEYCYGQDAPCDFCESYQVLKTGQPHHWEVTTSNGRLIDTHDVPFTDVDGTPMILEMDIDITDRRKSELELLRYQEQLEQMVQDRTASLEDANKLLKKEIEDRTQAEEAFHKNETMLRTVLDQMPSGVTVRDAKTGGLLLANNQAREIMGILADNSAGFSFYRGKHPDGRPYAPQEWPVKRSMATGEVINTEEIDYERADGAHITLSINSAPIYDAQGQITMGVGVFQDITERKQAEQRLAYLASFPERNPNPIVEIDLNGKIHYANPAAMSLLPELALPDTDHEWLAGLDAIIDSFKNGKSHTVVRDVAFGTQFYQQSLHYLAAEGLIRIYGLEITKRKQVEAALMENERRLSHALEISHTGSWELDLIKNKLTWSDETYRIFGYQPKEFEATYEAFLNAVHPDDRFAVDAAYSGSIREGHDTYEIEHRLINRSTGELRIVQEKCVHYRDETGRVIRSEGMVHDITERKLAEQVLQRAHDELEQRVLERTQELKIANDQLRAEVAEREKTQTELEASLQELQVIEEELRNNNEMLQDAHIVLDEERQRYEDLFEFAPDAYLVTDKNGKVLEANQYATKLLAISHHRLIGKPLLVFIAQADHLVFNHLLFSASQKKGIQTQELRLKPRHGSEIISSAKVALAEEQARKYALRWTIRDITQRKQAEEIIRHNALRNAVLSEVFQALTGASLDESAIMNIVSETIARLIGDGCVITQISADGQWLEPVAWHHKKPETIELMSSLFGITHNPISEGLSGQVFHTAQSLLIKELAPSDAQAHIPSAYQKYVELVGIASLLIVPIQIANQTIGTLGITRDKDGQPYTEDDLSMVEILASRTGQAVHNARLYQELQKALRKEVEVHDQLVQTEKFAAVGRLLASITHEINNPLQTIKNCLYLGQEDTQPGTPMYDVLNMAVTETNRLSNLVAQLREIYRPPTQRQNRPVELPALVGEVQVLLTGFLQEKHVNWLVTLPDADLFSQVQVEGVPDQLKQVFLNLCLNAIDAMEPNGGSIKIDFRKSVDDNRVGVRFRDTGPGLPPHVKAKLFEPFTTTKEKGLGLGLVICYDIIQKHHGQIEVESEPGEGAAFTVWLPGRRKSG